MKSYLLPRSLPPVLLPICLTGSRTEGLRPLGFEYHKTPTSDHLRVTIRPSSLLYFPPDDANASFALNWFSRHFYERSLLFFPD